VLRIAYFSPLPPDRSGISDYSAELLPYLAQQTSLTLFAERPHQVSTELRERYPILPTEDYPGCRWDFDIALYQMGNSRHHISTYEMLLRYPGVTVLHEYGLHHLALDRTLARRGSAGPGEDARFGYTREMGYENGVAGIDLAYRVFRGRSVPPVFETPLNARTLDHSLGLITHSHFAAEQVRSQRPGLPVQVIPAPIRHEWPTLLTRSELGCPDDALLFASAGMVTRHKQIPLALEAFARLAETYPYARFVVIGGEPTSDPGEGPDAGSELDWWIDEHRLRTRVIRTGFVPDLSHFVSWIAAADVLVNLRHPTLGETSATALRGMAAGLPVVVFRSGWYAELPDDVCVKVEPGDLNGLVAAMSRLGAQPAERRAIGERARTYTRAEHNPALAAARYIQFIEKLVTAKVRETLQ
jgi:glycosyltransferase involved in cell wall biosynthesis